MHSKLQSILTTLLSANPDDTPETILELIDQPLSEFSEASMLGSYYASKIRAKISENPSSENLKGFFESTGFAIEFDNGFGDN